MGEKASLGKRCAAHLLDSILLAVVLAVFAFVVSGVWGSLLTDSSAGLAGVAGTYVAIVFGYPLAYPAYHAVMEAMYGYTIGKHGVGLVVKTEEGEDIGWSESLLRNLIRLLGAFVAPLSTLVAALLIAGSDDEQRLGDVVGSTVVVEQQ